MTYYKGDLVTVVRRGGKNWRIRFEDGREDTVPKDDLEETSEDGENIGDSSSTDIELDSTLLFVETAHSHSAENNSLVSDSPQESSEAPPKEDPKDLETQNPLNLPIESEYIERVSGSPATLEIPSEESLTSLPVDEKTGRFVHNSGVCIPPEMSDEEFERVLFEGADKLEFPPPEDDPEEPPRHIYTQPPAVPKRLAHLLQMRELPEYPDSGGRIKPRQRGNS